MRSLGFVSTAHIHFKGFAQDLTSSEVAARIGAIWDDDEDRGRRNAALYGADFLPDLAELAARPDLDGFVVCAPNNQRLELLGPLMAAGKPVMCEKPLALTAAEAGAIRDRVRANRMILTTGFFRQSYGVFQKAEALVRDGAMGTITHARFRNAHDGAYRRIFDDPDVAWMRDPAIAGGGGALDMGAHALHLLAWIFGPADEAWATISNRSGVYPELDDDGIMHIRFRNGVLATAEAGWITIDEPGALVICGSSGSLYAADVYEPSTAFIIGADKQRRPVSCPTSEPKGVGRLLAAMDGRVSKESLAQELDAAAHAAAIMEAAYRSNGTGTWQPVEEI